MLYYAVAYHGTAGIGASHGYAEVLDENEIGDIRQSMTTTVTSFETRERAQQEVDTINAECEAYRLSQNA